MVEFSVENFRSIKDRVVLSMVASSDKSLKDNLIESEAVPDDLILRSAAVFGPNASGKTNVLYALNIVRHWVIYSHANQRDTPLQCDPFRLDSVSRRRPSRFEVVFVENGVKYIYGLSVKGNQIIDEYLYHFPNRRKALLFKRTETKTFVFTKHKRVQNQIAKITADNVLYLSRATQMNYEGVVPAFKWFSERLRTIGPAGQLDMGLVDFTARGIMKDPVFRDAVLNALHFADIGISGINASVEEFKEAEKALPSKGPIKELVDSMPAVVKQALDRLLITTVHKVRGKKNEELVEEFNFFTDESEGTKRFFTIIGPLIAAFREGHVMIIDELDVKMHDFLVRFLIEMFHDSSQNSKNPQLVFTTHNVNLLDLAMFRRDQIYFTEKSPERGNTRMYSLCEFSPRKEGNILKSYLSGKYGAVPYIQQRRVVP